jgi:hypothetical protein
LRYPSELIFMFLSMRMDFPLNVKIPGIRQFKHAMKNSVMTGGVAICIVRRKEGIVCLRI